MSEVKSGAPFSDTATDSSTDTTVPVNLANLSERVAKLEAALERLLMIEERLDAEKS